MKALCVFSSALAFTSALINFWCSFCNRCDDTTMALTQLGNGLLCFLFGFYNLWLPKEFGKERK